MSIESRIERLEQHARVAECPACGGERDATFTLAATDEAIYSPPSLPRDTGQPCEACGRKSEPFNFTFTINTARNDERSEVSA